MISTAHTAAAVRRAVAEDYQRPILPAEYRHALVQDLTRRSKPLVFPDGLGALARFIHRMRGAQSLQLQDRLHRMAGEAEPRLGVLIYARDMDRWAHRCLGWAWLDGGGWRTLRDALAALDHDDSPASVA